MPNWVICLSGSKHDLSLLMKEGGASAWAVRAEGNRHHLTMVELEHAQSASEARAAAERLLERLNAVGRALDDDYQGVKVGSIIEVTEDGRRHTYVEVGTAEFARSAGWPSGARPTLVELSKAMDREPKLEAAWKHLQREDNWYGYYKAFELVMGAIGRERGVRQPAWASLDEIKQFRNSARPRRHSKGGAAPPYMSGAQARRFISRLLRSWAQAVIGGHS